MSRLEAADKIEGIVGAPRHLTLHLARAVSAEQRVYIMHSHECCYETPDLRDCEYSRALDNGIEMDEWEHWQDRPVMVRIDPDYDELTPWPIPESSESEPGGG
jgi:hypothetical protein